MFEIKVTIEAGRTIEALAERLFSMIKAEETARTERDDRNERNAELSALASTEQAQAETAKPAAISIKQTTAAPPEAASAEDEPAEATAAEQVEATVPASSEPAETEPIDAPAESAADAERGKGSTGAELAKLTAEFVSEVCQKAERATLNKNLRQACDKLGIAIATVPSLLQAVGYDEAMRLCVGG